MFYKSLILLVAIFIVSACSNENAAYELALEDLSKSEKTQDPGMVLLLQSRAIALLLDMERKYPANENIQKIKIEALLPGGNTLGSLVENRDRVKQQVLDSAGVDQVSIIMAKSEPDPQKRLFGLERLGIQLARKGGVSDAVKVIASLDNVLSQGIVLYEVAFEYALEKDSKSAMFYSRKAIDKIDAFEEGEAVCSIMECELEVDRKNMVKAEALRLHTALYRGWLPSTAEDLP